MKRDVRVYIEDILESISRIEEYTRGITQEDFCGNTQIQDAVFRRLEVIGEAVKNIPLEFRNKYPKVPWKSVAGIRDVLIHAYFGVSVDRTWKVATEDILELKNKMLRIKDDLRQSGV
jgi:uncharacterized protein with HEPN domain